MVCFLFGFIVWFNRIDLLFCFSLAACYCGGVGLLFWVWCGFVFRCFDWVWFIVGVIDGWFVRYLRSLGCDAEFD